MFKALLTKRISLACYALVLICMFMPFARVSCKGEPVAEVTGWDMATGYKVGDVMLDSFDLPGISVDMEETESPNIFMIIMILVIIAGMAAALGSQAFTFWSTLGSGILSAVLFTIALKTANMDAARGMKIQIGDGVYAVYICFALGIVGSALSLFWFYRVSNYQQAQYPPSSGQGIGVAPGPRPPGAPPWPPPPGRPRVDARPGNGRMHKGKPGPGYDVRGQAIPPRRPPPDQQGMRPRGIQCRQCGTLNHPDSLVCSRCGMRLR